MHTWASACDDINVGMTLVVAFCVAQKTPCQTVRQLLPSNKAILHEPSVKCTTLRIHTDEIEINL